ncbi:MAG: DUF222 domain-containing protein [Trebonia sp.]
MGDEPVREPGVPGGTGISGAPSAFGGPASAGGGSRDERLRGFARGGEWDSCRPGPELAAVLAGVAGAEWRFPGAEPDELIGVLRRAAEVESWASSAKLAVIRELIRQDDLPALGRPRHGDLPDAWSDSLNHELALALACSVQSAEKAALSAWELGARLPGIAALLADGTLTYAKAALIAETFQLLSDADAARAEALILPQLIGTTGKTYGQIINLSSRAATEVDPGLAERQRKAAVKHASRVQVYREQSGAAALAGRELPPDEALAADANVTARAVEYKDSGAFPGARMDEFRATAYLDLINGRAFGTRIALGHLSTDPQGPEAAPGTGAGAAKPDNPGGNGDSGEADPGGDGPDGMKPPGGNGPGRGGSGNGGDPRGGRHVGPVLADLVLPLATLLGLAERPGEAYRLGVLDPGLCRDLAALAAASPHTSVCVTVTDRDGVAIGHGCVRPGKSNGSFPGQLPVGAPPPPVALPARVNLTITTNLLSVLSGQPPPPAPLVGWAFTRADTGRAGPRGTRSSPDDPPWCGTWTLMLPGGLECAVHVEPVLTYSCDHRYESHGYQPNDTLRHLVQVRDYLCTFPSCSRHARDSDFEHARAYDKGGRTCGCNAGARSRKCHRVKQSPGWNVAQPRPGLHVWTTPTGRTYTQVPYRYPV